MKRWNPPVAADGPVGPSFVGFGQPFTVHGTVFLEITIRAGHREIAAMLQFRPADESERSDYDVAHWPVAVRHDLAGLPGPLMAVHLTYAVLAWAAEIVTTVSIIAEDRTAKYHTYCKQLRLNMRTDDLLFHYDPTDW